ncbi:Uncharacterised protein g11358 [Pycnogonum litorale]
MNSFVGLFMVFCVFNTILAKELDTAEATLNLVKTETTKIEAQPIVIPDLPESEFEEDVGSDGKETAKKQNVVKVNVIYVSTFPGDNSTYTDENGKEVVSSDSKNV